LPLRLLPGPAVVRSLTAGFGLTGGGTGDVTVAVDPAVIQQGSPARAPPIKRFAYWAGPG